MKQFKYIVIAIAIFTLSACSSSSRTSSSVSPQIDFKSARMNAEKIAASNRKFIDGIKEKSIENYVAAIKNFEESIKLNPYNDAAYFELSHLYLSTGQMDQSLKNIKKANELDIENHWYIISYIEILEILKAHEEALPLTEKLLSLKPKEVDYWYKRLNIQVKLKQYPAAISTMDSIEKRVGINKDLSMQKEELYRLTGNKTAALNEMEKLYYNDTTAITHGIILAETYFRHGFPEKGETILKRIIKNNPNSGRAYLLYAELEKSKGNDLSYYSYLIKAFEQSSLNIDMKMKHLVTYFNKLGQQPYQNEALELSKVMIKAHPRNAKAYAVYADFLYNIEELENALEMYLKSLEINKSIFTVWHQTMLVAAELEDFNETIRIADESLEYFPNQSMIYYIKSIAQIRLNDYEGAVGTINAGIDLTFDNPALKSEFYSNLGEAYYKINQYEESYASFDAALKINPDNVIVLNNYSYYLSVQNDDLEKAKNMSKRSNLLDPDNNSFEDTYAWILYKMSNFAEALIWIEKALSHGGENSATIVEHYGDVLFKLDRKDEAYDQWIKSKNLGNTSEFIDKKIEEKKLYE